MIQANSLDGMNYGRTPSVRGVSGSQFTLKNVPPGRTTISVNIPPPDYYVKAIRYAGKEVPQSGVDMTTGGSLEIVLSNNGAVLAGRVVDAAGKAAGVATVALTSAAGESRYEQNVTDNNGEFRFPVLPPGEYKLYAWQSADRSYLRNTDLRQFESRSKAVKLEAGSNLVADVTAIPAAEFEAASGASAPPLEFPRTRGSVQGQVLDGKTGGPIKNALVHLNPGMNGGMAGAMFASIGPGRAVPRSRPQGLTAETDEAGNFTFHDVEPGIYQLGAERQGFVNGLYGAHPDMSADSLVVGEGQDLSKVAVKLARQAVVAGKVTDEYGDAMVNTPVSIYSRDPRPGTLGNSSPARTANTDSLGEFRVAGLAAGTYILAVRPTPPLTAAELGALPLPEQPEMRHPVTYYPASLDPAGAKPIAIESGGEVAGIDVKLQKTASFQIRGTLTGLPPARTADTPQDALARSADTPQGALARSADVPQSAPARSANTPQGALVGSADTPQGPARSADTPQGAPARSANTPQSAPARSADTPQDALARSADTPQDAPARSADVPQGAPARPPMVSLYPAKAVAGLTLPSGSVSARRDGSFTIAGVLPGSYLLTARTTAATEGRLSAGVLPIEVKDKHLDGIQVALKPAIDVKASVSWEKATTVSLNGLFINLQSVYPTGSGASGQLDGETTMTFSNVLAIPYKVGNVSLPPNCLCFLKSLRYGGREIPESGADLTTGQPFEIVLSSGAAIVEGTVVDREGKPVYGAALALAPKDSSLAKTRTGFADDSGKFFFDNNPPGEYRLLAWEDVNPAALNDASFLDRFDAAATLVKLEPLGRQTVHPVAIPRK
jgi:protocatechuate 3,4-dioxygenase beta subunit